VSTIRIEVIAAWPHRFLRRPLELEAGSTVSQAVALAGLVEGAQVAGYAVFGVAVQADAVLRDGDRLELLRPLQIDPKEARRRRAAAADGHKR
jgi:putative ubiquitin-RnfH superfamily antitoxin RatB of RatAB toxin-antitoxin module